jgi:cytochrome c-type biogenesis protein CcmH
MISRSRLALQRQRASGFVSGHDFSRAVRGTKAFSIAALAAASLRSSVLACAFGLALVALLISAPRVSAQQLTATQAARAKSLSLKVKCMCGGCNDPAGACFHSGGAFSGPCDMALSEIKQIDQKVSTGESDSDILKDFVAQYGPTVLVDPPKAGFNLTAWVVPVVVPLLGLFGVWEVARRWRQRRPVVAAAGSAPATAIAPEMIARVRHDIEKDER